MSVQSTGPFTMPHFAMFSNKTCPKWLSGFFSIGFFSFLPLYKCSASELEM